MAESPNTSTRLDELRQRWEQNPDSRVFLQLAEEYRHLGRLADAASCLEQGLERRPKDAAAMVALGRCRLDLDQVATAVDLLEGVLTLDPAHIVANKLLVDGHLRRGDEAKARDRLSFYRLLNDRDPELDHFEYRLSRLAAGESEAVAKPEADLLSAADSDGEPETERVVLPVSGEETPVAGEEVIVAVDHDEPFGLLPTVTEALPHVTLEDGPFDLSVLLTPVLATPPTVEVPGPDTPPPNVAEVEPAASSPETPAGSVDGAAVAAAAVVGGASAAVATALAGLVGGESGREDGAGEGALAAWAEVPTETELVEPEASLADATIHEEPEVPAPALSEDRATEVPATLAMAEIYEQQGYRDEASQVIHRVLAAEPDNQEARALLAQMEGTATAALPAADSALEQPLTAADLLAGAPASGTTARKVHVLERYLERIQSGRSRVEQDHVH